MQNALMTALSKYLGIESNPVSHTERLVSALGGTLVIASIFLISRATLGPTATLLIVPSMGASAVLLFAVPHGALSQPWNVFGGHVLSAITGVSCAMLFSNEIIAASAAVGIAIGIMHYLRCIHPPGGATALAAVIGGEATQALGYQFVITPVLINTLVMLATGEADQRHLLPAQIVLGHYYSSTEHGDGWSVRQIVDESHSPDPQKDMVVYEVIAGAESSTSGVLTRTEFARWATHELVRDANHWKRLDT
jgi:hypothetical protein